MEKFSVFLVHLIRLVTIIFIGKSFSLPFCFRIGLFICLWCSDFSLRVFVGAILDRLVVGLNGSIVLTYSFCSLHALHVL